MFTHQSIDTSVEAPPSLLPPGHYCDITGLEGPYTDPVTGLRYHDKSVYELIKGLVSIHCLLCRPYGCLVGVLTHICIGARSCEGLPSRSWCGVRSQVNL